jgi:hypothetical protein
MSHTAVATLQTIWDCKWSRPAAPTFGSPQDVAPVTRWMCIRTADRRAVSESECETCPFWEFGARLVSDPAGETERVRGTMPADRVDAQLTDFWPEA